MITLDTPRSPCDASAARETSTALEACLMAMTETAAPIMHIKAKSYLSDLRTAFGPDLNSKEQSRIDLLDEAELAPCALQTKLKVARRMLCNILEKTSIGWPSRLLFVRQEWKKTPIFHVDAAALTIVFPLRHAPTLYVLDQFIGDKPARGLGQDLLLDTIPHSEVPRSPVLRTGENEIVLIKGAAWSGTDAALVHSPPSVLYGHDASNLVASAFILEFTALNWMTGERFQ